MMDIPKAIIIAAAIIGVAIYVTFATAQPRYQVVTVRGQAFAFDQYTGESRTF